MFDYVELLWQSLIMGRLIDISSPSAGMLYYSCMYMYILNWFKSLQKVSYIYWFLYDECKLIKLGQIENFENIHL